ncbi:hypothetical protein K3495_g2245 [Podosphaera aphanis]|nr:hypothetical protein K3495_g2245 [Podosphaera aphanis]
MAPERRQLFRKVWDDDDDEVEEEDTDTDDEEEDHDEKNDKDDKIKAPSKDDQYNQHKDPAPERLELSQQPATLIPATSTPEIDPKPSTEMAPKLTPQATPEPSPSNLLQTYFTETTLSMPTSTSTFCFNSTTSTLSKDMPVMTGFNQPLAPPIPLLSHSPAPPAPSPDEPRKEINSETALLSKATDSASLVALSTQTVLVPQTEMLGPIQATSLPISTQIHHDQGGLSPTAEHILVALGSIGAFIILLAATYFYFAMRGDNGLHVLFGRQLKRGGQREWLGLNRGTDEDMEYSKPPPQYSQASIGGAYHTRPVDEKVDPARYPILSPETPPSFTPPISQRQDNVSSNIMTSDNSTASRQMNVPVDRDLYNSFPQIDHYGRQPSLYNLSGNTNTHYSSSNYSNPENQGSYDSRQTSNIYNKNLIEANRLSALSSLSSGFGDGLQIPEPVIAGAGISVSTEQGYLPPLNDQSRFSWVPSQPRDTIYSSASVETAPRFRTVNSWVVQQSSRIEESTLRGQDVPPMPAVPTPYRSFTQREN